MLPLQKEEVLFLLKSVTKTPDNPIFIENKAEIRGLIKFNGFIRDDGFSISKKCSHPQFFIPLINGSIYETKENTIVRLTFQLFPQSSVMLFLVITLCLLLGCVFIGIENLKYAGISFGIGFLNYIVAYSNFHIHTKDGLADLVYTLSFD